MKPIALTAKIHFPIWVAILVLLPCLASTPRAEQIFPEPGWEDRPNPLASPHAIPGGRLVLWGGQSPRSLNAYVDYNSFSVGVFSAMYETLLNSDPLQAGAYNPGLAEKWSISEDRKTFTFWINPNARWSDGTPITAHDVAWTYETIMDPANMTAAHKVRLQRIDAPVVLSDLQIRFTAREVHWANFDTLAGGLLILPRHAMEGQDFNLINFDFPVVSGPYEIREIRSGLFLSMQRRPDYWNRNAPSMQGVANFDELRYRFFADRTNAYESFLKGDIDIFPVYTARVWANETTGERFDRNWIVKQTISNHRPVGFQGFAMNMRRPPFDDARVRKAMALLLDREKLNATLMYNQYFFLNSYFYDLYDINNPCPNPLVPFDKEAARRLLGEAGWVADPATGILQKDGQRFSFRFLDREATTQRFIAIYSEDLRDVGIELIPDSKDWSAWLKDMDEFNFQMTWAAWGAGIRKDPESLWSSEQADIPSGQNITGLKDPGIDALIEEQRTLFDPQEQEDVVRRIDQMIYEQHPYVLLWNRADTWLLYWNRFGTPPAVLSKYGDESSAEWLWWADPDAADDLEDAMAEGLTLRGRPYEVDFDTVMSFIGE